MKRLAFGLLIVAIGVLFLLAQLHVFVLGQKFFVPGVLWPLFLALLGLFGVFGSHRRVPTWPLFLIVLGLVLVFRNSGMIPVFSKANSWDLFWGLLIVFFGLEHLQPKHWRSHRHLFGTGRENCWNGRSSGDFHDNTWIFHDYEAEKETRRWVGDLSIGQHAWQLKDMSLWNGVGDIRVNLGTARVEPGEYHLTLGGWFGDVRILVPAGLYVQVTTNVNVGDVTVFGRRDSGMSPVVSHKDEGFDDAQRRVYIHIDLKVGDIKVVRV